MTKDKLIRDNAVLAQEIKDWEGSDSHRREKFAKLLDQGESSLSWLEISFLIGELKSDANYSMALQKARELQFENEELRSQLKAQINDQTNRQ